MRDPKQGNRILPQSPEWISVRKDKMIKQIKFINEIDHDDF